jgi:magnesium transporter
VRMERQTVSESYIHTPPRRPSLRIQAPTVDEVTTLPIPAQSPSPARHGDAALPPSPSIMRSRRRRRSTLQPADTQHSLSPPLGGSAVLGSGLSVGLGPMSPGFSIVPRDRRRRISGIGFGDVVEDARGQRRRTVSEGDMRRLTEGVEGNAELIEADSVGQEGCGESPAEEPGKKDANTRWNWVRRVFLDRR